MERNLKSVVKSLVSSLRHELQTSATSRLYAVLGVLAFCAFVWLQKTDPGARFAPVVEALAPKREGLTKENLAQALAETASFYQFPTEMDFNFDWNTTGSPHETAPQKQTVPAILEYSFDARLQETMEALFKNYRPDYGAFVAMDAETGRVLSMVSYSAHKDFKGNLALRATFPAASVFKMVTAAAAIETHRLSPDSLIAFNGANHTLYRSNILRDKVNRWTRSISLKSAFAQSINTVFGKLGAYTVGPEELKNYADRFGFNRRIASDLPLEQGRAPIPDDPWGLAETASGYTRENTMSPLQGALMAAAVVNGGTMMEPYFVRSVYSRDGKELYRAQPRMSAQAINAGTADEIRMLMHETVVRGTSRGAFRGFFKREFTNLKVGGKTGSLTGTSPKGKYDWFVGYGDDGFRRVAVAALTIHERLWRVKSSYLARRALETTFSRPHEARRQ